MYTEIDETPCVALNEANIPAARTERDVGNEHVVIGRLIRRLRVSEPPDRFHQLAVNVLRSSLGVEAVAWVPREASEPLIVSGAVEGGEPASYRALTRLANRDGTMRQDEVRPGR